MAAAPDPLLPGGGHCDDLYPASLQGLLFHLPLWSRASLRVQALVMTETCRIAVKHPQVVLKAVSLTALLDGLANQLDRGRDGSGNGEADGADGAGGAGSGVAEVVEGMQQLMLVMVRQGLSARTQAAVRALNAAAESAKAAAHAAVPNPMLDAATHSSRSGSGSGGDGRGGGGGGGGGGHLLHGRSAAALARVYREQRLHVPEV